MFISSYPYAAIIDMNRCLFGQPDMSVDAASLIPPAFRNGGVYHNGNQIRPASIKGKICDVYDEACIAAKHALKDASVKIYRGVCSNPVEFK
ncbi:hypothetical protein D3C71_1956430 [compost metagenome]